MFKGDKCELTSSLSIIKQDLYRNLKDEIDDSIHVVQQGVSKVCSVDNKHVHTIVLPFGRSLHSVNFLNIIEGATLWERPE